MNAPPPAAAPKARAAGLLRARPVWMAPLVPATVLMFFMTLFYIGAIVNPTGHLRGLPVALVNEDRGAVVAGERVDLGADVASQLLQAHEVTSRLSLKEAPDAEADALMDSDKAFEAIIVPPDFSARILWAYGLTSTREAAPTVQVEANPRAGSTGVQLASGVAEPALEQVSTALGKSLSEEAARLHRSPRSGTNTSEPVTVVVGDFRSLPPDSALGLSAFYISLLALMCGFLGAVLVNSSVDAALGYGTTEVGPRWRQRLPVNISRWQTLLVKWSVALLTVPTLTGVLLLVSVAVLHMNAPHAGVLWTFTSFAGLAIAAGTLALFATFGSLGQLLAMLVFVYLALASSGGTIPVQALPSFFRFTASFEPLRQVLGGVRAILYFNAQADAGLDRGFVLSAIGLALWIAVGTVVTKWYDRRGLDRLNRDVLEFMQRSARAYLAGTPGPEPARVGRDQRPRPAGGPGVGGGQPLGKGNQDQDAQPDRRYSASAPKTRAASK